MKRLSLLALLPLSMLACKKDETPPPAPARAPTPTGSAAPAPAAVPEKPKPGNELNLFAWSEYVPQEVIDGFTKETGIKVNYEAYGSNEEMLSKLLAGGTPYDLIQPSDYTIEALAKQNLLEAIDKSMIPNLKNLDPAFTGLPFDPDQKFAVPWLSGTVGIVVNTDKVKEPVKSYKDLFQKKYKGRIVVLNDSRQMVAWAFTASGLDANDVTPENLAKIRPMLAEWIKLIKVFDSDSPKTAFLNGDVDVGLIWSGEAALLYMADKKFQYTLPEEGVVRFIDCLAIPTTSKNKLGAMMFMDYILRPEVSKIISEKFPYTNPNLEARKLLTPDQIANPASYPPAGKRVNFRDIGKVASDIDKLVTDLKAAN